MSNLELKHLCGYLPYELKFISELDVPYCEFEKNPIWTMNGISLLFGDYCLTTKEYNDGYPIYKCKPLLLPLSALTEPEFGNILDEFSEQELYDLFDRLNYAFNKLIKYEDVCNNLRFEVIKVLFENHFDVYGLVNIDLAVNKRTIKL